MNIFLHTQNQNTCCIQSIADVLNLEKFEKINTQRNILLVLRFVLSIFLYSGMESIFRKLDFLFKLLSKEIEGGLRN